MGDEQDRSLTLPLMVGVVVGAATWWMTMASAPRSDFGDNQDTGSPMLFPALAVAAAVLGYFEPRRPKWVVASLLAAPLVLAPWTTPRGDEDGLWVFIFPMLALWGLVMLACASAGGRARRRDDHHI